MCVKCYDLAQLGFKELNYLTAQVNYSKLTPPPDTIIMLLNTYCTLEIFQHHQGGIIGHIGNHSLNAIFLSFNLLDVTYVTYLWIRQY